MFPTILLAAMINLTAPQPPPLPKPSPTPESPLPGSDRRDGNQ